MIGLMRFENGSDDALTTLLTSFKFKDDSKKTFDANIKFTDGNNDKVRDLLLDRLCCGDELRIWVTNRGLDGRRIRVIIIGFTYNHDCGTNGFGDTIDFTASIVK